MNAKKRMKTAVAAVLVLAFLLMGIAIALAATYDMTGEIAAIDLSYQTVVIKCPLASNQIFTVGGPLAPDAKWTQNMQKADLNDFINF